jgi:hypothetical protein
MPGKHEVAVVGGSLRGGGAPLWGFIGANRPAAACDSMLGTGGLGDSSRLINA